MEEAIQQLSRSIRAGEVAVFCGAGISKNSGLPLANELKRAILAPIITGADAGDLTEAAMRSQMPFEQFIEDMVEAEPKKMLLEILGGLFTDPGLVPNSNHAFLAKLAAAGCLHTLVTTNFDLLLERALAAEGLQNGPGFRLLAEETEFAGWKAGASAPGPALTLTKIHGSPDKNSMRTILFMILALAEMRAGVIEHLFSSGPHQKVLVLGYSCSDIFDITPAMEKFAVGQKEVIFIEHSPVEAVESIALAAVKNPFKACPGQRLKCNTGEFIRRLWNSLEDRIGPYRSSGSDTTAWKERIEAWGSDLQKNAYARSNLAGVVCARISHFEPAIQAYSQALQAATEAGNLQREMLARVSLAEAYLGQGDLEKVIQMAGQAHQISIQLRGAARPAGDGGGLDWGSDSVQANPPILPWREGAEDMITVSGRADAIESRCSRLIGMDLRLAGDYPRAIQFLEKSLKFEKDIGWDPDARDQCSLELARCYAALGVTARAAEYAESTGNILNPYRKADYLACRGYIAFQSGDLGEAVLFYQQSLQIDLSTGNRPGEAVTLLDLGDTYEQLRDYEQARECFERALEAATETGAKLVQARGCTNLGYLHFSLRDFGKSLEFHQKAREAEEGLGVRLREGISYQNVGSALAMMGKYREAVENYLQAERIFKEHQSDQNLRDLYRNLALAYSRLGEEELAQRYRYMA